VDKMIGELWAKYDVDRNGVLDKNETRKFIDETIAIMGG